MKKPVRPRKKNIDQKEVSQFLESIGFYSEKIEQEWRHVVAFGSFQNSPTVFKLASTQITSDMTKNEFFWNEMVHSLQGKSSFSFTVPLNISSGYFGKLFYFIAEKFPGEPLVHRDSPDIMGLKPYIQKIATTCFELRNLSVPENSSFFQNQMRKENKIPVGEKLLLSAIYWAEESKRDVGELISVIEKNKNTIRTSPGHGDFAPRQLYLVHNKIGIIDGEHAGVAGALYYDPAWFYLRLRFDHHAKELAELFVYSFFKLLSKEDQKTFWEELKPVLTQRLIGEICGAKKDIIRVENLEMFGREILADTVFKF